MMILQQQLTDNQIEELGVRQWPIWEKEISRFSYVYEEEELCYFLEGIVVVETEQVAITIRKGDYITFPKGLSCVWDIKEPVRKHYLFR
ncbi:MAG: cupin [Bacteroidetes bacterium HGW-Bacteroidetes-11]|jgi:hypothetical protein|nr:MAG: cupin [Bacteroidetes bacterium HGW-Bacteroidetes-11]